MDSRSERTEEDRHRYMVEDITVTPFFSRHKKHMPATIKLHAEIKEEKEYILLESKIPGHKEDDVLVSATPNTINVDIILERSGEDVIKFHNSYYTPVTVDPSEMQIEHKDGVLKVKIKKKGAWRQNHQTP